MCSDRYVGILVRERRLRVLYPPKERNNAPKEPRFYPYQLEIIDVGGSLGCVHQRDRVADLREAGERRKRYDLWSPIEKEFHAAQDTEERRKRSGVDAEDDRQLGRRPCFR